MSRPLHLALALALVSSGLPAAPEDLLGPVGMEGYAQTFTVRFRSPEAARQAVVRIAPLYHDFPAALSTRMDDSTVNDLVVPGLMARYGMKGTFYLNSLDGWYQDSPATGIKVPADPGREIPARLLAGGNSIGGHTQSHEFLPVLSKNAAFAEIMANRAALEVGTGTPVNSFVYPFISIHEGDLRNGTDRSDLEAMLRRAGYYQVAEHRYNRDWASGLQDAVFLEIDGHASGDYPEAAVTAPRAPDERPLFLITMHAWVSNWGAPDFPQLAALYARWAGRQDLWYCTTNAYAAYRYQAQHARLVTAVHGDTVRAVLVRPDPRDLNDAVPLTFRIEGVDAADVVSVAGPAAEPAAVGLGGSYAFDLPHDRDRGGPEEYGQFSNPENVPEAAASTAVATGLQAHLFRRDHRLVLSLRNAGAAPLRHLRLTWRLPLRWENPARQGLPDLSPGAATTVHEDLDERADPGAYATGPELDEVQVDYAGARRGRVYAGCTAADGEPPATFARNGFWVLGPLAGSEPDFDLLAYAQPFLAGAAPQAAYPVKWSGNLSWGTLDAARAALLDPDIIPTTGKGSIPKFIGNRPVNFPHQNAQFLLYGQVAVPAARRVRALFRPDCIRQLSLNGQAVTGDTLDLRAGVNDLRILYAPAQRQGAAYDTANYGCYFRLVDATGQPLADLRYQRPAVPRS